MYFEQKELHSRPSAANKRRRESEFSKSWLPRLQRGAEAIAGARGHRRGQEESTDLQAGHAAEHGRGVSEVDPLRQQVAAIGEVEKILPFLAPEVLAARVRHVPPDACTDLGSVAGE